jgi:glycosyltransferase involved in cell wall biosynthesis
VKIAILFPHFQGGGAESVALWMIETLKTEHEVTLITFSDANWDAWNQQYRTHIRPSEVKHIQPYKNTLLPAILTSRYNAFTARQHLLLRYFKSNNKQFDFAIGAFNEMDLGMPGMIYFNAPMFGPLHERYRQMFGYPQQNWRSVYHRLLERTSNFSVDRMRELFCLANSHYVAAIWEQIYKTPAHVLYPPVTTEVLQTPWENRTNDFLLISRMVPEKQIERAVFTIEHVRQKGYDINLHIVSASAVPHYRDYIFGLQKDRKRWLHIHERLSPSELKSLMKNCRYGIHTRENEQFGIAVAEMVRAGLIPFVPDNGGPKEILNEEPLLCFKDANDAIEKICSVLDSSDTQSILRQRLQARGRLFSTEAFQENFKKLFQQALQLFYGC